MKDELGGNIIMTKFVRLRPKAYFYLIHHGNGDKRKAVETKCWIFLNKQIEYCNQQHSIVRQHVSGH